MQSSTQQHQNRYTEVASNVACRACGSDANVTVSVDRLAGTASFRCPHCGKQQEA